MLRPRIVLSVLFLALSAPVRLAAQQLGDPDFRPAVEAPAYATGAGPVVLIDAAHHNFHTADARFAPFADLLRRDGYVVRSSTTPFTPATLADAAVLVIANALAARNVEDWTLPTPSAFTDAEINTVAAWVHDGGALLLIADHMPFPGAAEALAARFGIAFANGFAQHPDSTGFVRFRHANGTLRPHPATRGRTPDEAIDSVFTFTGQAFRALPGAAATPLLVLPEDMMLLLPVQAWQFSPQTPAFRADGLWQGAVVHHGAGRVAVFGEAAQFTAQLAGPQRLKIGMNHPDAPQNAQFALNLMHWLSGLLPPE